MNLWTTSEISYLESNYHLLKSSELSLKLNRTCGAIRKKACELSLNSRSSYEWGIYEISQLIYLYRDISINELSLVINRSVNSIYNFVRDNKDFLSSRGFVDKGRKIVCKVCFKDFILLDSSRNKQLTCSFECSEINRLNYQRRWQNNNYIKRKYTRFSYCMNCLSSFVPKNSLQKYCNTSCYKLHSNCKINALNAEKKKKAVSFIDIETLLNIYGHLE